MKKKKAMSLLSFTLALCMLMGTACQQTLPEESEDFTVNTESDTLPTPSAEDETELTRKTLPTVFPS